MFYDKHARTTKYSSHWMKKLPLKCTVGFISQQFTCENKKIEIFITVWTSSTLVAVYLTGMSGSKTYCLAKLVQCQPLL